MPRLGRRCIVCATITGWAVIGSRNTDEAETKGRAIKGPAVTGVIEVGVGPTVASISEEKKLRAAAANGEARPAFWNATRGFKVTKPTEKRQPSLLEEEEENPRLSAWHARLPCEAMMQEAEGSTG
ncbi:hypothetical protein cyc_07457 [Cyclospora cayetanensis]|uniref:Uncharacterized protein n=1 Tax=Cyclospora cayetanensis TaxID=88456 RepID=A0A1D3CVM7_9EIME|nr:hypothetical protein cyc_07457 [Cyclospora cayetanensis]